jgi:hypothetical protein
MEGNKSMGCSPVVTLVASVIVSGTVPSFMNVYV